MPDNKWRVRLEGTVGGHRVVIGAGFLVDSRRVLTCAHVVRNVADIRATFAQAGRRDLESIKATAVFETAWSGVDDPADVAVLELEDPVDIAPARLEVLPPEQAAFLDYQVDDLKAHGYPATSGLTGAILRTRITSWSYVGEWIPIEAAAGHAEFPRMGFSGAAVFDEHTGHVLGMITTGNTNSDIRIGRMLPCEIIRKYWEDLDDLLDLRWLPPAKARALHAIVRDAQVTGS